MSARPLALDAQQHAPLPASFGKYRVILALSVVYCAGHAVLAVNTTQTGLIVGLAVLVLTEILSSLATRRLMANAWGLLPNGPDAASETRVALHGAARLLRRPARVVATALTGWLVATLVRALLGG